MMSLKAIGVNPAGANQTVQSHVHISDNAQSTTVKDLAQSGGHLPPHPSFTLLFPDDRHYNSLHWVGLL